MTRSATRLTMVGVAVALALLMAMAFTGAPLGLRNYVPFEARGLMTASPEHVTRVELVADGRRVVFIRDGGAEWRPEATSSSASASAPSRVDAALRFLHVSAPVRTLSRGEYAARDVRDFGLDPPRYIVRVFAAAQTVLELEVGVLNPMRSAQYVRCAGRDDIQLLPAFVGREWESMLSHRSAAPASSGAR